MIKKKSGADVSGDDQSQPVEQTAVTESVQEEPDKTVKEADQKEEEQKLDDEAENPSIVQLESILKAEGGSVASPEFKSPEDKSPEDGPFASPDDIAQFIKDHEMQVKALREADGKMHFSYELEKSLTVAEREADAKLQELGKFIDNIETGNLTIMNYFEQKEVMENCQLFKALDAMPKGAIHHVHTTAANPIDAYLKLTYDDRVYFNDRDRLFKVFPKHQGVINGYLQCTKMRNFSSDPELFDKSMKDQILLGPRQANDLESHDIWKFFQHKFTKVGELGKFIPFFREITKTALERCIAQNVFVVEYRHISGMLFDDNKSPVPFIEELKIFREIVDELQEKTPHFDFRLIITGLKIIGESHMKKMIQHIIEGSSHGDKRLAELISGFDMVNEEDFTPEIGEFAKQILAAKQTVMASESNPDGMPCFFHAGETHQLGIKNLHDAIMFGTKRIGHGFQLELFPKLQDLVKERDICIEVCPLSNMVLGYCKDLRTHPMKQMLSLGVQASINSDDPGLFGYEGVTLDYIYAFGAWELTIRDLKKFSLNGIKYASITEQQKENLYKVFDQKWTAWIEQVNSGAFDNPDSDKKAETQQKY